MPPPRLAVFVPPHSHSSLVMDLCSFPNRTWHFWGLYPPSHVPDKAESSCSTTLERWMTTWMNEQTWNSRRDLREELFQWPHFTEFTSWIQKNVNWLAQKQFLDKYVTHTLTHTNSSLIIKVNRYKMCFFGNKLMCTLNLLQNFFNYRGHSLWWEHTLIWQVFCIHNDISKCY